MLDELEKSWIKLIDSLSKKSDFSEAEVRSIEFLVDQMEGIAQTFSAQPEIPDM